MDTDKHRLFILIQKIKESSENCMELETTNISSDISSDDSSNISSIYKDAQSSDEESSDDSVESDEEKFRINKEATAYFNEPYDCLDIDGVRIRFLDGWGLVRASNTQPVIVCRFEAKSEDRMKEIKNLVLNKISELGDVETPADD